ncbi:alpha/beta hydrolase, partial [Pseudomonas aeruginosa]
MKTSRPRALPALSCLLASLAHPAPDSILRRPYALASGQGVLRGSWLLPRSAVPPPVVLLVAGSGPTDRDGNNPFGGNNRYLLRLAEALAERGIASVRYD